MEGGKRWDESINNAIVIDYGKFVIYKTGGIVMSGKWRVIGDDGNVAQWYPTRGRRAEVGS